MGLRLAFLFALAFVLAFAGAKSQPSAVNAAMTTGVQGDADCSGDLGVGDALADLHAAASPNSPSECTDAAGDIDCSGEIDGKDSLGILRYLAEVPESEANYLCVRIGDPFQLPPTSEKLIAQGLADGDIDYETSLLYRAYALYGDERLPPEYQSGVVNWQAAGPLFAEVDQNEGTLSQGLLDQLASWRVRPADPQSIFNQPNAAQPAGPVSEWGSDLVAGGHVRVWAKGNVFTEEELNLLNTTVEDVYAKTRNIVGDPNGDTPGDPDINPDEAIDVYYVDDVVDPRASCLRQPTCQLRGTSLAFDEVRNAAPYGPSAGGALASSAYLVLAPFLTSPDLLVGSLAQAFAYAETFAYDINEEEWLTETTVDYTAYETLLQLDRDRSRFHSAAIRDVFGFGGTLTQNLGTQGPHGSWLYLLFATMEKDSMIVKQIWEGAAAPNQQGPDAIDDVFPFEDYYDDFALMNFNREPPLERTYGRVDGSFPDSLPSFVSHEIRAPVETELPTLGLDPLTASYDVFEFLGSDVRTVRFENDAPGAGNPRIWGLVNIDGEWQAPEDWTDIEEKKWCRDDPAENVTEIVVIYADTSRTEPVQPNHAQRVKAEGPGCNAYVGTSVGFQHQYFPGGYLTTTGTDLRFEYVSSDILGDHYQLVSGKITTVASDGASTDHCHDGSTIDIEDLQPGQTIGRAELTVTTAGYLLEGVASDQNLVITCDWLGGGQAHYEYGVTWVSGFHATTDFSHLMGSNRLEFEPENYLTWSWDLRPIGGAGSSSSASSADHWQRAGWAR